MTRNAPRAAPPRRTNPARQRGGVYLVILGAAMLITVLGLAALTTARIQGRSAVAEAEIAEAKRTAAAAVELGRAALYNIPESTWRSWTAADMANSVPLGAGRFSLAISDPVDGNLANLPYGPVVLTATGTKGAAVQRYQIRLSPLKRGLECLNSGLHAGGVLTLTNATVNSDRMIGSNLAVTALASDIQSHVEAVLTISGGTYAKPIFPGSPARSLPGPTALDYYITNGQRIDVGKYSSGGSGNVLQLQELSDQDNREGGENAQGIYVIDCANQPLTIQNARIQGTIVLLDPGPGSIITGSIRWDTTVANYPALLVRGSIRIAVSQTPLSEATHAMSFNEKTPYNGVKDADKVDSYPSSISGLIYATGNISLLGYNSINGVIIAGGGVTMSASTSPAVAARLDLRYNPTYYTDPPPGFAAPTQMVASPGSFVQVVD